MAIDKTPWTDETVMPWGQHEGTKLEHVPASYLLWIFEQPWIADWPGLHAYLKKHEKQLIQERGEPDDDDESGPQGFESFDDYLKDYRGF